MADLRVGMIGSGNVAWNLAHAIRSTNYRMEQVIGRTLTSAGEMAARFQIPHFSDQPGDLMQDLDLVFILTNDHAIAEVAAQYAPYRGRDTVFVHSSGSIPLAALAPLAEPAGIFYPLQTFTRSHLADFSGIPVFLEGSEKVLQVIEPLARQISSRVSHLNSKDRLQLHLGAVFASNFVNFMLLLSEEAISKVEGADLSVYEPLVREVIDKAFKYGPREAHTGPARRGDQITMKKHLDILAGDDPERAELYRILSRMIAERFKEK
jgi:predicted short-subunit dehydrogenase-like oxidoreductase (DUF2520 family)